MCELLDAPPGPVISLGGGAAGSERVRAALARHVVVLLDVDTATAWQRAGGRRPLARDRERFTALHAERRPLYDRLADVVLTDSSRDAVRRAVPAMAALAARHAHAVGAQRVRRLPGLRRAAACWALAPSPRGGRAFLVTDETVGALYARVVPRRRHDDRDPAGRGGQDVGAGGARAARACAAPGWRTTTTCSRSAAAWSATSRASAPRPTSAASRSCSCRRRSSPRSTPPTAARPASTCRRARTTPAPTTSRPRCSPTRRCSRRSRAEELAAGWAEVIKTALIAGGALWERVRDPHADVDADLVLACARTKLGVVAQDERDQGRRQVLNLGHTVGHAIETATGYARYRHGEAVGLGLLAALTLSGQPDLRGRGGGAARRARAPDALDPAVDPAAVLAALQRDKKRRGGRVGFVLVEAPGDVRTGRAVRARRRRARSGRVAAVRNRVAVHARREPRRARPAPRRALRRTDVRAPGAPDRAVRARSSGSRRASSTPTTRASTSRSCTRRRDYADALLLNPGAWTHYAWSIRDAVELTGLPAVEVHLSDVKHREPFRAVSVLEDVCVATVSGQGVDGYRVGARAR